MNYLTGALRFILIVISIPFFMFVAGVRFPKAEEAEYRKLVETWCRRLLAMLGVLYRKAAAAPGAGRKRVPTAFKPYFLPGYLFHRYPDLLAVCCEGGDQPLACIRHDCERGAHDLY